MGSAALILVDTHVRLWADRDDPALGSAARHRIDEASRRQALAVSAVSFCGVALLQARARIRLRLPVAQWRRDLIAGGPVELAVDGEIGIAAVALDGFHADPADRMIVSTAVLKGATLLTADERILKWPGALPRHDARR